MSAREEEGRRKLHVFKGDGLRYKMDTCQMSQKEKNVLGNTIQDKHLSDESEKRQKNVPGENSPEIDVKIRNMENMDPGGYVDTQCTPAYSPQWQQQGPQQP